MSMNATFVQVDAGELSRLQGDPSSVEALFQSGFAIPDAFIKLAKAMEDRVPLDPSLRQVLAGGLGGARSSRTAPRRAVLSLDKAWHGVHYILCGQSEPGASLLSGPVLGGTILGDDDEGFSGYGPPRFFTAAQVAELAAALNRPEIESEAASRFDAERMSGLEIYPGWRPSDSEWLMDEFRRLRDFYADAAAKGNAIVTCLV